MKDDIKESVLNSLDGRSVELYPYLPYLLKDLWEIGTSAECVLNLLKRQKREFNPSKVKVLDLGCGKGAVSITLAKTFGFSVVGIDAVPEFVQFAREKAKDWQVAEKCRFEVNDIREYVNKSDTFDIIILGSIGQVFGNIQQTLKILSKCLTADGFIILDDGYIPDGSSYFHNNYLPEAQFDQQIRRSGFRIADFIQYDVDDIQRGNEYNYSKIKQRAQELISMYPGLRYIFDDYLKTQRHENEVLENHIQCMLMLIEKNKEHEKN